MDKIHALPPPVRYRMIHSQLRVSLVKRIDHARLDWDLKTRNEAITKLIEMGLGIHEDDETEI